MKNKITSKDYWYVSIVCIIASILAIDFFSSLGLFICSIVSGVQYFKMRNRERREEQLKKLEAYGSILINLAKRLEDFVDRNIRETPKRKTTSRRGNKK